MTNRTTVDVESAGGLDDRDPPHPRLLPELADRLREADRRRDEFLAQLAHELRNPLASIHNAVSVMRLKTLGDPQLAWCRDVVGRQTDQLIRLVDDLLDVSRITLGKIQLRRETVDLRSIAARAVETSQPLIEARRHQLVMMLPEAPLTMHGDGARLTQIVANLLSNAAKYQSEGGSIELLVERDGEQAVIRVRDRGAGIPPELLPRVFEPFTQGDRPTTPGQGGLGLGLALVKCLVEMHGGAVTVTAGDHDRGSEFTVRLPCRPEPQGEAPAGPQSAGLPAAAPRRILVVDDSVDAAESLALLLRMQGHEVSVASDGECALRLAIAERPAVILLDLGLPGMDGYETCRRIRALGLTTVHIVALTGYGQDRDRERSRLAGFDTHAVKPVSMEELVRVLTCRRPSPDPLARVR